VVLQSSLQKMKGFLSRLRRIVAGRETWGCMAFQHRERRRRSTKSLNHENKVKVKGHDTGGYFT
jgi:hypothetical protein